MALDQPTTMRMRDLSKWPRYEAAAGGLPNYWYPITWSRAVGRKPSTYRLLGEPLMLLREQGRVYAFHDQCPHRGIPLSVGRQDFPGTWSCRYHGWCFDLATGVLKAALTDGPDSPICGKVRAQTYPVEERAGLVWVYVGDEPAPPVEADIPEAFLHEDAVIVGRITVRPGNWRYAAENGFDDAHARYLHRYGSPWTMFKRFPAWGVPTMTSIADGQGIRRDKMPDRGGFEGDYPGLGRWPKSHPWQKAGGGGGLWLRLPGFLCSQYATHAHYEWYVPVDRDHHRYLQFLVTRARGWSALEYRLRYWLYRRWLFHGQFNDQDGWMVRLMPETGPERLFRPDASITAWRRLFDNARGATSVPIDEASGEDEPTAGANGAEMMVAIHPTR
jgi:nitrite reductase/ring-hydroxylating ferredoxin subunit